MTRSLLILLCVALAGFGCSGEPETPPVVGELVTQQGTGYQISVPANWDVQRSYMGTDIIALSPLESSDDPFRENINVAIEEIPTGMSLLDYYKRNLEVMEDLLVEFSTSDEKNATVGGQMARRLRYTHVAGELDLDVSAYFITLGNRGYAITCSALPESFDRYDLAFQSVVNSFALP